MLQSDSYYIGEICQPFEQQWHAELFATTVHLNDQKLFLWSEWTKWFGDHLRHAGQVQEINGGDDYYQIWLDALIKMITQRNITDEKTIETIKLKWAEAYKNTPHGKKVEL